MNTFCFRISATKMGYMILMLCLLSLNSGMITNADALITQGNTSNVSSMSVDNSLLAEENSIRIDWSTFLGGTGSDVGTSIAVDDRGNIYVAGTSSASWGNHPIRPYSGSDDVFVAKFNNNGQLLWNTFLGGPDIEKRSPKLVLDSRNNLYIVGTSSSTWGENIIREYTGNDDSFVAKINSTGVLVWNSFLGGEYIDVAQGVVVDSSSNIYITGHSDSSWGSPFQEFHGGRDAFVSVLSENGDLLWNTFVGDTYMEGGTAIALDKLDDVYIFGYSYWTWGNPIRMFSSPTDTFVAKINSSGGVVWNTFLGGRGSEWASDILISDTNELYVAGNSQDPWGNPIRPFTDGNGATDAFIAKLDTSGNLIWNTFIGGSTSDYGQGFSLDSQGNFYIIGNSDSSWGFPSQPFNGNGDVFFAIVSSQGELLMNTFLGSIDGDAGFDVVLDQLENIYITGMSGRSWGKPIEPILVGPDAFVAKLSAGATPTTYSISGRVVDGSGNAISGVIISGDASLATTTDSNGNYTLAVPQGWSGVVTPSKTYYNFFPPMLPYINVQKNYEKEDYTAMLIDSDGDGLWDDWEVNGVDFNGDTFIDIDFKVLDEFGEDVPANPNIKDIYVYVNWLYIPDTNHNHKPSDEALSSVKDAFQRENIQLHIILGGGIPETPDNEEINGLKPVWNFPNELPKFDVDTTELKNIRKNYFLLGGALNGRASVYRYAVFGHSLARPWNLNLYGDRPIGFAIEELSTMAIGLGYAKDRGTFTNILEAITFMHELGHTLGLGEGGVSPNGIRDEVTFKPNHLSVMNYSFGLYGLIYDEKEGRLDYSHFDSQDIPPLNEKSLYEKVGLASQNNEVNRYGTRWYCDGKENKTTKVNEAINWNCLDGINEAPVMADINNGQNNGGGYTELFSWDEWGHLKFRNGTIGIGFSMLPEFPDQVTIDYIDLPADEIFDQSPIEVNEPPSLNDIPDQIIQYSDYILFSVSASDPDNPGNTLIFSATGFPSDVALSDNEDGTAIISGMADVAPGTYIAQITVTDPDGLSDTKPVNIVVTKEDARATYTGSLMVSTGCTTCSTATIPLRATIQDITAVLDDPSYDSNAGNITKATVRFVDRNNANTVLCSANVTLFDLTEPTVGTATCNWIANIGASFGTDYTIGAIVDGYYSRNNIEDDVVVVVSKPTSNFVSGGGYFINKNSGEPYAGDSGEKTNFGLNIKFTQKLTNLQGRVTIIVRQGGHVYKIKSTALNSLVAIPFSQSNSRSGTAELVGKATVTDVTDPLNPITVASNATLNVTLKDNGEPGSSDLIGISLWSKDGKLLYSNNWSGTNTIPQTIDGGNLQVH